MRWNKRKTKRKEKGKQRERSKEKEIKGATEKESLVLKHNINKTSVFLRDKLILSDSVQKPFIYVLTGQKEIRNKGEKTRLQKKLPLRCTTAAKTEGGIEMLFYNKGEQVKLLVKEIEEKVIIKIKKREYMEIALIFPRGTKEKINYIDRDNSIFSTKVANFFSSDGYMFSLKTAKEWDIEITKIEKRITVKGEKAKINIIYGQSEEDILQKYYGEQIRKKEISVRQEVYINVDEENYKQKIEYLKKKKISFDGIIVKKSIVEKGQKQKEIVDFCKQKEVKVLFKIKPYIKIKEKIDQQHLVKGKEKAKFIQEIDGEKYFAIDLSNKETRIWLKNKVREFLDLGIKGFIAEKGKIDEAKTDLEKQLRYSYGEVWYILWQKLIKEVVAEYPQKILLLKDNGTTSYRYGKAIYEDFLLKNNECSQIKQQLQNYKKCGMGDVAIEFCKCVKKWNKTSKNLKKRTTLAKEAPFLILPDVPEKIIYKMLK